ncbi:cytochrome P450 [Stachybotrys elegans]|uniref:Cytochrome P450 n=1 Tax=Stachybotrys elegans TaxID=80388 RepID=A0A8K0WQP1_9HYPO|nr:cytochrome P450 [Stachybotrys elegans]
MATRALERLFPRDVGVTTGWIGATLLATGYLLFRHLLPTAKSPFPLVGEGVGSTNERRKYYVDNALQLFREGLNKFKDSPWRVTTADGEILVLPLRYAEELRRMPEEIVSVNAANEQTFEGKHVGISPDNPLMVHVVKGDLTQNLPRLTQRLSVAVKDAIDDNIGPCDDWKQVNIYQSLLRIVAVVSGNIFLGPELSKREDYLHSSIHFTTDLFIAISALKRWPTYLRSLAKFWVPQLKTVDEHRRRVRDFLVPVIRERRKIQERGGEEPDDMLTWLLNRSKQFELATDEELAETLLVLGMAAIHTTTMAATHIIFDLIGYCPEVIPELRKEILSVMDTHEGGLTTNALYQMKLLDSVMRESQRMNPSNIIRMQRVVLKSFRFSDGTEIPAGASLAVPSLPILHSEEFYPSPGVFEPHRFKRLRENQVNDPIGYNSRELYQFISVTKENMGFGFGKHACPGRFFAANEIKLVCAHILLGYDLALPDDTIGRYGNIVRGGNIVPDRTKTVLMRKRDFY